MERECELIQDSLDSMLKRCIRCKAEIRTPDPPHKIHMNCMYEVKSVGLLEKAVNFSKAIGQHVSQGMPVCSELEIQERFAICVACPFFIKKQEEPIAGECSKCGCKCNTKSNPIKNKLAMKSQHCPVGKW
jgi:hypothetical protein